MFFGKTKVPLSFAIWFLALLACGRYGFDPRDDSCFGVTCSGHGACAVTEDHRIVCACEPGYHFVEPVVCVPDPKPCGAASDCDDRNPCTEDRCSALECINIVLTDGASCSNNDICDGEELCEEGTCQSGIGLDCSDSDPCTTLSCDPELGCVSTPSPDETPCADGDACTRNDACKEGVCSGVPLDPECDDDDPCTADSCAGGACVNFQLQEGASCSNDNVCDGDEVCRGGICGGGVPLDCTDPDPCWEGLCDPKLGCYSYGVPNGALCDDRDGCTHDDVCGIMGCAGTLQDGDGDGYPPLSCGGNDCDDGNLAVNPAALEGPPGGPACNDSIDNDCDGMTDAADPDCPGGYEVWAVGDDTLGNGVLLRWNAAVGIWSLEQGMAPAPYSLYGVWGTAPDNLWLVGANDALTLHWDGALWSTWNKGVTSILRNVWGNSASNIWIVGAGRLLHWDGAGWSRDPAGNSWGLYGISGTGQDDIWAVGVAGTIVRWAGAGWSTVDSGTAQNLTAVWAIASDDAWAVGQNGTVLHWNGFSWSGVDLGTAENFAGVWAADGSSVWICSAWGSIWHWDGNAWETSFYDNGRNFYAIWGSSGDDIWTVGSFGTTYRWDGKSWTLIDTGTTATLNGVWGIAK